MNCDYLVVGSGLTGATIARILTDAGHKVIVLERRPYLGGNVADLKHQNGILVGLHGPHYFRTSSDQIWQFVNRFAEFHAFSAIVKTKVNGELENWPVAASYIRRTIGQSWRPTFNGQPANFEEAALALMPREIYDRFVRGYTEKQWGAPAHWMSTQLCKRFDIRHDDNPYLTPNARYQGIPTAGYSAMMRRMLADIPIELQFNYLSDRRTLRPKIMTIYTGPIDEYFAFSLGKLQYRGQSRRVKVLPHIDWAQSCGQINYPDPADGPKIRTIEWKHMMPSHVAAGIRGTIITTETPCSPTMPDAYEYPFPDHANEQLLHQYQRLAHHEPGVLFCGRLGEYRYFDMDQAIGRGMMLAQRILTKSIAEAA